MPLTIEAEAFEGIGQQLTFDSAGGSDAATLRYQIVGADDHDEALDLVIAKVVSDYPSFMKLRLVPGEVSLTESTESTWLAEVKCKPISGQEGQRNLPPLLPRQSRFSFSTGGGRQTITEAISQAKYGSEAKDFGNRINVNTSHQGETTVDGVEVITGALQFTLTQRLCPGDVTIDYMKQLSLLTGTVNADAILGFAAGELLLVSGDGGQTADNGAPEVVFQFAASPNRTNIDYDGITVATKKGHEYIWVNYVDTDDGNDTVKSIRGVYVATTYRAASWTALKLTHPETAIVDLPACT